MIKRLFNLIIIIFIFLPLCVWARDKENDISGMEGTIVGKVYIDANNNGKQDEGEKGIEGVTLILENGIIVITGSEGKFSITNIKGGFHTLKLDDWTLPPGIVLVSEEERSKFINLPSGGTVKVDFRAKEDL
jgi:hypothetical protein